MRGWQDGTRGEDAISTEKAANFVIHIKVKVKEELIQIRS